MTIWFTSDTHFYHKNIIGYTHRRYETVEEMNEGIIDTWNACVQRDDVVYHLGDFAFAGVQKATGVLHRLNGRKHLIVGNHDVSLVRKEAFKECWEWVRPYHNLMVHDKDEEGNQMHQRIVLCHYPFAVWDQMHHGSWMLHGHCHGSYEGRGKIIDVGIDSKWTDQRPIPYERIKEIMSEREFVQVDHHNDETN